jgi:hypothetical protein
MKNKTVTASLPVIAGMMALIFAAFATYSRKNDDAVCKAGDTASCITGFGTIGGDQELTKGEIAKMLDEKIRVMAKENLKKEIENTEILEFDLTVFCEGKDVTVYTGRSNTLNKDMKERLRSLDSGCKFYFEHVIAKGPGGTALWPKPVRITVK